MKTACVLNRPWVVGSDQTKQSTRQLQGLSSVLSLTEVVRAGNDFGVAKSTSDNNFFNGRKKTDLKMTRRMIERNNILGVSNVVAVSQPINSIQFNIVAMLLRMQIHGENGRTLQIVCLFAQKLFSIPACTENSTWRSIGCHRV